MNASDLELLRYKLDELKEQIMVELDAKIAEVNRSFDAKSTLILDAVAALRAEVAEAKKNSVTPEALAELDAVDAKIDAFDPFSPVTLPPPEPVEPPPVEPQV